VCVWIVAIEWFESLAIWLKCTLYPLSLGSLLIGSRGFQDLQFTYAKLL